MPKVAYTQALLTSRSAAKQSGLDHKEYLHQSYNIIGERAAALEAAHQDTSSAYLLQMTTLMELNIVRGRAVHVFMPDRDFCDWLVDCVKEVTADNMEIVRRNMCDTLGVDYTKVPTAVVRFPTKAHVNTVSALPIHIPVQLDLGRLAPEHSLHMYSPGFGQFNMDVPGGYADFVAKHGTAHIPDEASRQIIWYVRLITGLSMYIDAFPDHVRPGIPDDIKHINHYKGVQGLHINTAPVRITHGTHSSPIGHFRSGHFRTLRSERYTKARGKTVFVRGSFVNGAAETVVEP
jgi:hypothetical protein